MLKTQPKRILFLILGVSVLLRLGMALYLGNEVVILPGTTDQLSYHHLALRLLGGHGLTFGEPWWPLTMPDEPTAHWSFLYTFYAAVVYQLFGPNPIVARIIQAVVVGILQPYLAYLLGRRLFGEWVGLVAALLTAVYFYFIYYAATLMTESFYITAILASLYLTILMAESEQKHLLKQALMLGLLLGGIVLLRQLYLLVIPFQLLWLLWARYRRYSRAPLAEIILAGLLVIAMILPFTYYNYTRFNRIVLLNTNAGYAFFLSNHPLYGTRFIPILDDYRVMFPEELKSASLDEAALDQELLGRGLQFVVDDPVRYLLLSLSRIPVYFTFWPTSDSGLMSNISRVGSIGLMLPFMLYGIFLALRRNWSWSLFQHPAFLLILFALVYTGIHVLTWALVRYRLPVDAVLVIFAAVGIVDLVQRFAPRVLPEIAAQTL
jgi:4-amino-4-deoxy-L-arabinose transferase-like glycosyltransferase